MTHRERVLAVSLVSLMVLIGGAFGGYLFVYRPLADVNTQLTDAESKLTKKQQEVSAEAQHIENLLRVNPRLQQWTKLSLPPRDPGAKKVSALLQEEQKRKHLNDLQVQYELYLHTLLNDSGLKDVKVDPRAIERRSGQGFKGPPPAYERLAFGATGRGTMTNVSKALREFHKTPLLHQVRNLAVSTASSQQGRNVPEGTLDIKLTVEALMMAGGEERVGLLPSKLAYQPRVLAEPSRDYDVLNKRNMFTGFRTSSPTDTSVRKEKPEDVLRFVKLTMLEYNSDRDRWEASIYDQSKGGKVKKLAEGVVLSGVTIRDRYKNPVLEGKVVRVNESQMVIRTGGKYYRLSCGDVFLVTTKTPLKKSELTALGIDQEEDDKAEKAEKAAKAALEAEGDD